ncbi:hypothetical protein Tco_0047884 [Tanacetum coccineum]
MKTLTCTRTTNVSPQQKQTVPSQQELDLLFGPLYDEFFNDGTSRVNKSSSPTDNSIQQDTLPSKNIHPTTEPSTPTHVNAEENNDNQAEFTNPFCTSVHEIVESSSRNIGTSNIHTFNQPQDSEYRWTKDHSLTQVRGNPSKPVQTRRQLATDPEMRGGYVAQPDEIQLILIINKVYRLMKALYGLKQAPRASYALSWKPCQGDSLNLPDHRIHKDGDGDASFQLKSDSLPHAHAQTTKTFYKHQDSRIMKSTELKTKTSAQNQYTRSSSKISSLFNGDC